MSMLERVYCHRETEWHKTTTILYKSFILRTLKSYADSEEITRRLKGFSYIYLLPGGIPSTIEVITWGGGGPCCTACCCNICSCCWSCWSWLLRWDTKSWCCFWRFAYFCCVPDVIWPTSAAFSFRRFVWKPKQSFTYMKNIATDGTFRVLLVRCYM